MIRVVVDDLAAVRVDAVVRPASTTLEPLPRPHERLEQLAAPSFGALDLKDELAVGSAVVTDAANLGAGLVIHAVIGRKGDALEEKWVRRALESTLHRAAAWQLGSLAIPPLGVGGDEFSVETAARIMSSEIQSYDFSAGFPNEIVLVVGSDDERELFERATAAVSL